MTGSPRDGVRPTARVATVLGCSEGRVHTLAIGLVLAVVLIVFGWPAARIELLAADAPPGVVAGGPPATAVTVAPDLSSAPPPAIPPPDASPPDDLTSSTSTPPGEVGGPPRDPGFRLPPELRALEGAVANLVREGCSRLSLVNVVLGLVPELKDPVEQTQLLRLMSEVYLACDSVAFPPTRIVCDLDRQVNAVILQSPLGLFFQSLPPVVGHTVELVTALTDTLFGLVGFGDPLVAPLLMEQLGCVEVEQ